MLSSFPYQQKSQESNNIIDSSHFITSGTWSKAPFKLISYGLKNKLDLAKNELEPAFFKKNIIGTLLTNTLYSLDPKDYCILLEYMEPKQDYGYRHPILHEISHQMNNNQELFKLLWTHPKFSDSIQDPNYKDEYGLNAKQRLSHSLYSCRQCIISHMNIVVNHEKYPDTTQKTINEYRQKCEKLRELIIFCRENFGVKPCKTEYSNYGCIKIPKEQEYLCSKTDSHDKTEDIF